VCESRARERERRREKESQRERVAHIIHKPLGGSVSCVCVNACECLCVCVCVCVCACACVCVRDLGRVGLIVGVISELQQLACNKVSHSHPHAVCII
jgi:hypothetical protein